MSTTIFCGYRLKSANLNKIQAVNESIKETITNLVQDRIYKLCVDSLIEYKLELIKHTNLDFWKFFEYCYDLDHQESVFVKKIFAEKLTLSSFFLQHLKMIELCSIHNLKFMLNYRANIFFKSHKNATYYIITGGLGIADELLSYNNDFSIIDGLDSYNYWNSTDKPDNISNREWTSRSKNWNCIFTYKPELEMNQLVIDPYQMYLRKESKANDKLFELIPDDHELLIKFYKKSVKSVYWDEFEKNGVPSRNISNLVADKINEEIDNGVHLNYADEAVAFGFTKDLMMDSLLNMKLSYPVI